MENNHEISPKSLGNRQSEDTNLTTVNQELNPVFNDLISPEALINSVTGLLKKREATPHFEILQRLIDQFEPLDFMALAYPESEHLKAKLKTLDPESEEASEIRRGLAKLKVTTKHYRILAIKNVINVAEQNRWGLCKNHDFIYQFNGSFWAEIDKETFQKFLGEASERMGVRWDNAQDYSFMDTLYKQYIVTAYLPKPESNKETVLINLQNGTFEISPVGTKLRPFDRTDFITYQLPFKYDQQAKAPLFEAYLNRVLPDKERQSVLAEFLAYVFIKHGSSILKEEKALILYGSGANGKSVFFEITNSLLGAENVSSFSLQSLTNDNGYYRAKLANKLLNYASEINGKLEASIFKQLVSGEPVEARLPYGEPFMLSQYAKLIFNCNELPKDVEHTNAYFRRFLIIPFDVTIPPEEQDKQLHTKIIENELSGVFNWVLEGLTRLLEQKRFSECEAARLAVEQYKSESNSVQMFLDENSYQRSSDDCRIIKELYPEYRAFCYEDGMIAFKKINFKKQLESLGYITGRESGTGKNIVYLQKTIE